MTPSVAAGLFALGLPLLLYIVKPLFRPLSSTSYETDEFFELEIERERSFRALADLDFDYESGKISQEDYEPLRAALLAETAEVLARIDARITAKPPRRRVSSSALDLAEREIARFKRKKASSIP